MKIAIDREKTEFEIQAEAMALLKDALGPNYIICGEYRHNGCRFDLAVFRSNDRELVCTIEIKKRGGQRRHGKQIGKYFYATGKPCILMTQHTMHLAIKAVKQRLSLT